MIGLSELKTQIDNNLGQPKDVLSIAATYEAVIANGIQGEVNIYLIPGTDDGFTTEGTGVIISDVDASVGVLIGVREVTDALGEAATDPLKTYREAVAGCLHGFRPADTTRALSFTNGALVDFVDGVFWQLDNYATSYNLRG